MKWKGLKPLHHRLKKRQKAFDKVIDEWKKRVQDLQIELEVAQRESRAHSTEVYKLRGQMEEINESMDALRKENKNLTGDDIEI